MIDKLREHVFGGMHGNINGLKSIGVCFVDVGTIGAVITDPMAGCFVVTKNDRLCLLVSIHHLDRQNALA